MLPTTNPEAPAASSSLAPAPANGAPVGTDFKIVELVRDMTIPQAKDYMQEVCLGPPYNDDREKVWKNVLNPIYTRLVLPPDQRKSGVSRTAEAPTEVTYLSSKVPIRSLYDALAFALSTFFQDWYKRKSNSDSKEWGVWMDELAGSTAWLLSITDEKIGNKGTFVLSCLWLKTGDLAMMAAEPTTEQLTEALLLSQPSQSQTDPCSPQPADNVGGGEPDYSQAMGTTLGNIGGVAKKKIMADRLRCMKNSVVTLTDVSGDNFELGWEAGRQAGRDLGEIQDRCKGGCAEVLPFLAMLGTEDPRRPNHTGRVSGFAIDVGNFASDKAKNSYTARQIRELHGKRACSICRAMFTTQGVMFEDLVRDAREDS